MTETLSAETWLTQDAYDRLQAEHEQLIADRSAVAARIESAREEGDLRENGGYHAAKEEQGKQEARIRYLADLLRTAQVGEAPQSRDGLVAPGMLITVLFEGETEPETFLLGSREDDAGEYDIYSPSSPIGAAIRSHRVGDVVEYLAPTGRTMKVELVAVAPFHP